jgi:hypothetical protein
LFYPRLRQNSGIFKTIPPPPAKTGSASFAGTAWSKKFLEAMDEAPDRRWAARIVTSIAGYYVLYRGYLAVTT